MESNDTLRRYGVTAHWILWPKCQDLVPWDQKNSSKIADMNLERHHIMFVVCNLKDKVVFEMKIKSDQ